MEGEGGEDEMTELDRDYGEEVQNQQLDMLIKYLLSERKTDAEKNELYEEMQRENPEMAIRLKKIMDE